MLPCLPCKRAINSTIFSSNETVRTVYVDNDNMDDIEILPNDYLTKKIPSDVTTGDPVSSYYQSSSMGIENPYSIEWDETIDYDYHGKFAKQERNRYSRISKEQKCLNSIMETTQTTFGARGKIFSWASER